MESCTVRIFRKPIPLLASPLKGEGRVGRIHTEWRDKWAEFILKGEKGGGTGRGWVKTSYTSGLSRRCTFIRLVVPGEETGLPMVITTSSPA